MRTHGGRVRAASSAAAAALWAFSGHAGAQSGASDAWPGLAGGPSRAALVHRPAPPLTPRRWTASADDTGSPVWFIPNAGMVVAGEGQASLVIGVGRVSRPGEPPGAPYALAFAADTGEPRWSTPIDAPSLDSFSTPAIDAARALVVIASGSEVAALRLNDGVVLWKTQLPRPVVNASPLVVDEGPGTARVFITDYDGFGDAASLHCLRLDDLNEHGEPQTPGELLWSAPIGASSGNTPAYLPLARGGVGLVYVSTPGEEGEGPGIVRAFPAFADGQPCPAWSFQNVLDAGFFGGLSIREPDAPGEHPHVFAASYAFFGGLTNSNLVKLDACSGTLVWSAPASRTSAIPALLPGGRILLSGGISGFGSVPSVRLYADAGATVATVWDSALDSWVDADHDGTIDPGEYLRVGGWSNQPVVFEFAGSTLAACGVPGTGAANTHPSDLLLLDLSEHPSAPSFVRASHPGIGASPAAGGLMLFATGAGGLGALGIPAGTLDLNADGSSTIDDLYAWETGLGMRDLDASGVTDAADRAWLITRVRLPVRTPAAPVTP
ncbi:MAG: PQQ-binding-like beta-propeller repeat protein [Planctomycetota bacterium]|nr:PQQ-binding-like beta-propeller repeat protein [Planctomycetota bacterium]